MKRAFAACLVAGVLGVAGAAGAHCSFAMFDQSRVVAMKGTIAEVQWTAPHTFFEVNVPGADGKVARWSIEANSPSVMHRLGWHSSWFKVGDKVTLNLNPLRDGRTGGLFKGMQLADGRVLGDMTVTIAGAKTPHRKA